MNGVMGVEMAARLLYGHAANALVIFEGATPPLDTFTTLYAHVASLYFEWGGALSCREKLSCVRIDEGVRRNFERSD
jgi:hypothetical protein